MHTQIQYQSEYQSHVHYQRRKRVGFYSSLYIMLLSILLVLFDHNNNDNNNNYYVEACMPSTARNSDMARFDNTWVCVLQTSNATWVDYQSFNRSAFEPQIDQYSRIVYPNSWKPSFTSEEEIAISVQSMGVFGYQKMYRKDGKTFPLITAIISMENGVVQGILYDDGCSFCEGDGWGKSDGNQLYSSSCVPNTYEYNGALYTGSTSTSNCYIEDSNCMYSNGEFNEMCNLHVYVTWTGTDKNGNYLTSSQERFSLFNDGSVASFVDYAETKYQSYA